MAEYCKISGSDIKSKVTSSGMWDEIDIESSRQVTFFVDVSTNNTLKLHTTDNHGNYFSPNSFSLDSGANQIILDGNYPNLTFSLTTSGNTVTAFYESG